MGERGRSCSSRPKDESVGVTTPQVILMQVIPIYTTIYAIAINIAIIPLLVIS